MEFRPYQNGDAEAVVALYQRAFARPFSFEPWKWRFLDNPHGKGIVELAWDGNVLACHYAITAAPMEIGGRTVMTGLSGTTMTHPDYRGQGLFPTLARRCFDRMRADGYGMVWGFPNANSHRGFVRDLAWTDVYEIPTLRLSLSAPPPLPPAESRVDEVVAPDDRFDRLWQRVKTQQAIVGVRDRAHLEWRYLRNPEEKYRILACSDGAALRGYLVFKRYKDELQIVDMLCEGEATWPRDLLSRAIQVAVETSCKTVGTWCGLHHPTHALLEKLGFRNGEVVTYLGALGFTDSVNGIAGEYRNWALQMGDSDVY